MGTPDSRIDTYIEKAQPFAQPILTHIRVQVHLACPEVVETIKWGMPHFEYRNAILCSFASFKAHCAFTFWLGNLMNDPHGYLHQGEERPSMGNLGKITGMEDLPPDAYLKAYIQQAMMLIEQGKKQPQRQVKEKAPLEIPEFLLAELMHHPSAAAHFETLSASHRREYVEWITDAKTEATRLKRMAQTIQWLEEGKSRNWKYER